MSIPSVRSPACSTRGCRFVFILSLLFCTVGMISSARFHPQLALLLRMDDFFRTVSSQACFFFRRDDFFWPDSSPACFFLPQGLFLLPGFIPSLLFCAVGMISSARFHPQLALLLRMDYFDRTNASPTRFFPPQGLFRSDKCIPSSLFCSAGIISIGQMHPQLALFLRRD